MKFPQKCAVLWKFHGAVARRGADWEPVQEEQEMAGHLTCFRLITVIVAVALAVQTHGATAQATAAHSRAAPATPAGWTWTATALPGASGGASADSIACPSATLCVARSSDGDGIYVTDWHYGDTSYWGHLAIPFGPGAASPPSSHVSCPPCQTFPVTAVSCPPTHFCAVIAAGGYIDTSVHAVGGPWSAHLVDPGHILTAISCLSVSFCAAGDDAGNLIVMRGPSSADESWQLVRRAGAQAIQGIACPTPRLCVATDAGGHAIVSTNPAGDASAWRSFYAGAYGPLSCPSTTLCISGGMEFSVTPARVGRPWQAEPSTGNLYLHLGPAVSCPSVSFCAAAGVYECDCLQRGGSSQILVSSSPTAVWLSDVTSDPSCPSGLCVINPYPTIAGISCPSRNFCVAVDTEGKVLVGKYSAGPPAAPATSGLPAQEPDTVSLFTGATATFWAAARGNPYPTVRWEVSADRGVHWSALRDGTLHDGSRVSGATLPTLTIANVRVDENGREYRAVFTNPRGSAASPLKYLSVQSPPSGHFRAISAGYRSACALRTGGSLACFGDNSRGQSHPPSGSFKQVSASGFNVCAVRTSGTLVCWGRGGSGRLLPPSGTFTQVSTAATYACGVRTGGALACWGGDTSFYPGISQAGSTLTTSPPAGRFTQVSTGYAIACGVRTDRTLACWGENEEGLLPPPSGSFIQVSAGTTGACGLRTGGALVCWGALYASPLVRANRFKQISATRFACGVTRSSTLVCAPFLADPPPAGRFTEVSSGSTYACGVRLNGRLVCWGQTLPVK